MADGNFTQLQKQMGQQKKELERIESKLDVNVAQLRLEIKQMGIDMRKMFKQLMNKMDPENTVMVESVVEEPEFKLISSAPIDKLEDSVEEMKVFNDNEIADPKSDLVSLKHTDTEEGCYEEFLPISNSLQLPAYYQLNIFTSNLKQKIPKTVRFIYPENLIHAFNFAKQLESQIHNIFRRPFVPYKEPPPAPPNSFKYIKPLMELVEPSDCCSKPRNQLAGEFILVRRGNCSFTVKANVTEEAGASAILIVNNQIELFKMVCESNADAKIKIPVVMPPQDVATYLEKYINNNTMVSVALYFPKCQAIDIAVVFLWLMAVGIILCASYWSTWIVREVAIEQDKLLNDALEEFLQVGVLDLSLCLEEQILNGNQPDMDDGVGCENQDEEAVEMVEETQLGDEGANNNESSWSMHCSTVLRVKTLHISSPILSAKSPFVYKFFSNGMTESEQRHVTLRINASEEAALMELLNFMYSNNLSVTTTPALLDVLMVDDKFEIATCMRYYDRLLRNLPMTPESALLYLDLPSSVLMGEAVQPLTDAAKQYLAARYKDRTKFQEEVMALPLAGIEAIFSSDDLKIASEDAVYDFVLKWVRAQYPKLEDWREVLGSCLAQFIRFPYMSCRKLKKVLTCNDFDHDISSKLVLEVLFFKAEAPHRQRNLFAEESATLNRRFVERAYKYHPFKVVEFELPRQQGVVYLDLKREECANLFPSGRVYSQASHLGGQGFFLTDITTWTSRAHSIALGCFLVMLYKLMSFWFVEVLVQWSNSFPLDATWVSFTDLQLCFSQFNP